jgi:cytochrome P450
VSAETLRHFGPPPGRAAAYDWNRSLAAFDAAAGEDMARIRFWNQDIFLVNKEEWIHSLLVEQADAFRKGPLLTRNARPVLGNGLLTSDNALNRTQRRIISPMFAHRKVGEYAGLIGDETQRRIRGWRDAETLDIPAEMLAVTLAVMGRMLLGEDLLSSANEIGRAIPVLMNFAIDQLRSPLRAVVALPAALRALLTLNRTLHRRIQVRRAAGRPDDAAEADLLHALLFGHSADAEPMVDGLVRDETMTLFLAGLETVALAVAWSLYLLATHPEAYARVREEASSLDHEPTLADLPVLPYTLSVYKEAMRLYPPVYVVAREALREVVIGPHLLPSGAHVFVSAYVRHRRPELFAEPLRFEPERWLAPDAERALPRYAYLPFGGGPHVCVGGHFALMEGQLMLAHLARAVTCDLAPGQKIVPEPLFTLRPRNGLRMIVRANSAR